MNVTTLTKSTHFKLPTGILGAALATEDDVLIAGCMDGVYVAKLSEKKSTKIGEHGSYVSSVASLPAQNTIVSAGYDGFLKWYDLSTFELKKETKVHDFWSWDMAASPDQSMVATVTGQYLAGGYKYEPLPEREPSVKVLSAKTGELIHSLPHVPSVQAVALSPDNQFVAAGNLMGEIRVWDSQTGELEAQWTTPDFTSWGVIKSHCYLGGIFALKFTPDGNELLMAGMGPMRDPMAGNGKQLWQKWSWKEAETQKVGETIKGEAGEGLMETLAIHPQGEVFAMGGRLRGGDWNVALFNLTDGKRLTTLKTGYRVTEAIFTSDGTRLILVGSQGQPGKNDKGIFPDFGRVEVYELG